MNTYKYTLDKSSKKFVCPSCGKKKLVRYVHAENLRNYVEGDCGRCDREASCGYHKIPRAEKENYQTTIPRKVYKPIKHFIPKEVVTRLENEEFWLFNQFLLGSLPLVPEDISNSQIIETIRMYRLGTIRAGFYKGALTIPFIDAKDRIHAIQVKCFDDSNHTTRTNFFHSILEAHYKRKKESPPLWLSEYLKSNSKVDCLFGEHLLKELPYNPIAIVEAPKTAFYCNLAFGSPYANSNNHLWLSSFNLSALNMKRLKAVEGRNVTLFPDASLDGLAMNKWLKNAEQALKQLNNTKIQVDTWLERGVTEEARKKGADLADAIYECWLHDYFKTQKIAA